MPLIPSRGRPAVPIGLRLVRYLQPSDLERLSVADRLPRVGVQQPRRLRAIHHRAAELVASGHKNTEVARELGLTPQRIVQLKEDPSFCDLVAYYDTQISESTIETRSRVEIITIDNAELATVEMNRRLATEPEKIGIAELRQIAAAALDRTIMPAKPAQVSAPPIMNVTLNLGPRALEPKVIEGEDTSGATDLAIEAPASADAEEPE